MTAEVLTERRGAAFIVSFNRPDRANAISIEMATQLFNVLKVVTTDRAIRAVLLRGMGGNFMDGYDPNLYSGDFNAALERANTFIQPYHSVIRELQVMDKPVVSACTGMTAGPGMSFMVASDLVIAARGARFNGKFAAHAMSPEGGCSFFLPRKVGIARAAEILMLDNVFGTAEAERWNLVNLVVDDARLEAESLALIDRLANGPTRAYGAIKKLLNKAFEQDSSNQLALEHTYWGASVRSFDFRENLRAQFAKRPAKFTGS